MRKVVKVSINKTAFTLSEEAYHSLKIYLDHLRRYYSYNEDEEEIVDDIEETHCRTSIGTHTCRS